jgi:hypothetical protein
MLFTRSLLIVAASLRRSPFSHILDGLRPTESHVYSKIGQPVDSASHTRAAILYTQPFVFRANLRDGGFRRRAACSGTESCSAGTQSHLRGAWPSTSPSSVAKQASLRPYNPRLGAGTAYPIRSNPEPRTQSFAPPFPLSCTAPRSDPPLLLSRASTPSPSLPPPAPNPKIYLATFLICTSSLPSVMRYRLKCRHTCSNGRCLEYPIPPWT